MLDSVEHNYNHYFVRLNSRFSIKGIIVFANSLQSFLQHRFVLAVDCDADGDSDFDVLHQRKQSIAGVGFVIFQLCGCDLPESRVWVHDWYSIDDLYCILKIDGLARILVIDELDLLWEAELLGEEADVVEILSIDFKRVSDFGKLPLHNLYKYSLQFYS